MSKRTEWSGPWNVSEDHDGDHCHISNEHGKRIARLEFGESGTKSLEITIRVEGPGNADRFFDEIKRRLSGGMTVKR